MNESLWEENIKIKNSQDFINILYSLTMDSGIQGNKNKVYLIQNPKDWLFWSARLSQLIEKNYVSSQDKGDDVIIWRIFVNKDRGVFAYFAYDEKSREAANIQPLIIEANETKIPEEIFGELESGGRLEFMDFKVVLSSQGKVLSILPWDLAYTTNAARCQDECRNIFLNSSVRAAFKRYKPDLKSAAELNALNAVVNTNSFSWALDVRKGTNYDEPGIFKLKISSDGQVVSYEAINYTAINKLEGEIPVIGLELSDFPDFEKPPYTDFKFETRGLLARISPWVEDE